VLANRCLQIQSWETGQTRSTLHSPNEVSEIGTESHVSATMSALLIHHFGMSITNPQRDRVKEKSMTEHRK